MAARPGRWSIPSPASLIEHGALFSSDSLVWDQNQQLLDEIRSNANSVSQSLEEIREQVNRIKQFLPPTPEELADRLANKVAECLERCLQQRVGSQLPSSQPSQPSVSYCPQTSQALPSQLQAGRTQGQQLRAGRTQGQQRQLSQTSQQPQFQRSHTSQQPQLIQTQPPTRSQSLSKPCSGYNVYTWGQKSTRVVSHTFSYNRNSKARGAWNLWWLGCQPGDMPLRLMCLPKEQHALQGPALYYDILELYQLQFEARQVSRRVVSSALNELRRVMNYFEAAVAKANPPLLERMRKAVSDPPPNMDELKNLVGLAWTEAMPVVVTELGPDAPFRQSNQHSCKKRRKRNMEGLTVRTFYSHISRRTKFVLPSASNSFRQEANNDATPTTTSLCPTAPTSANRSGKRPATEAKTAESSAASKPSPASMSQPSNTVISTRKRMRGALHRDTPARSTRQK